MTGREWYDRIVAEEPGLLVHCYGKEIWIHVPTGTWATGTWNVAVDELFKKLVTVLGRTLGDIEATEGKNLYSVNIGAGPTRARSPRSIRRRRD